MQYRWEQYGDQPGCRRGGRNGTGASVKPGDFPYQGGGKIRQWGKVAVLATRKLMWRESLDANGQTVRRGRYHRGGE